MKQRFLNKVFTTRRTVNNILRVYDQSDSGGHSWYDEAHEYAKELARDYLIEVDSTVSVEAYRDAWAAAIAKAAGIIASLSPLKTWTENKEIAAEFLNTGRVKHTGQFKRKAELILHSDGDVSTICEALNGNKITSFFLNILNPKEGSVVTIDRHAIAVAVGESLPSEGQKLTRNQYEFFANCYRVAAAKRGILPLQMQAVTWVKWRELKYGIPEEVNDEVPF